MRTLWWVAVLGVACTAPSGEPPESVPDEVDSSSAVLVEGAEVRCDTDDASLSEFSDVAFEQGLVHDPYIPAPVFSYGASGVVVEDLDGDGDPDVVLGAVADAPPIFANEDGVLRPVPQDWTVPSDQGFYMRQGAVDVDDDGLLDLVLSGEGRLDVSRNLGGLRFAAPETLWTMGSRGQPGSGTAFGSMAWGDVDGDGDLDAVLTSIFPRLSSSDGDPASSSQDILLVQEDDGFRAVSLLPDVPKAMAVVALIHDLDGDGGAEVLLASHRGPAASPTRVLEIDPTDPEAHEDVAQDLGLAALLSPMGIAMRDLNGDGRLDLCMTDSGPVACFFGDPSGVWLDQTTALDLRVREMMDWSGWGLEMADFDHDGALDVAAAGASPDLGPQKPMEDAMWRGGPAGGDFVLLTDGEIGRDMTANYGLATGDMDGDGRLEIIVAGVEGPRLYAAPCAGGSWVSVRLRGPVGNRFALGSTLTVEAGGTTRMGAVHAVRGPSQSPGEIHFGLGGASSIDRLKVRWPDGTTSEFMDIGVRRRIEVHHGEAP